jgi:hypothetical protein
MDLILMKRIVINIDFRQERKYKHLADSAILDQSARQQFEQINIKTSKQPGALFKEFIKTGLLIFGHILIPVILFWFGYGASMVGKTILAITLFSVGLLILGISLYIKRKFRIIIPRLIWWI